MRSTWSRRRALIERVRSSGSHTGRWTRQALRSTGMSMLLLVMIGGAAPCEERRCSCFEEEELEHALQASEAVFIGTVVGSAEVLEAVSLSEGLDEEPVMAPRRVVRIRLLGMWKGTEEEIVEIRTGLSTADCGFPFETGQTYLVFATDDEGSLTTGSCSRTALIEHAMDDLLILGTPPIEPSS